jgi:AcrR family transcriptional regulator
MARPIKDEALRGKLITAAADIIEARGQIALSAREIAAACHISPGTIYNYFANIEEIVHGVRDQVLKDLITALRGSHPKRPPTIQTLARRYLAFAMERPHLWAMLIARSPPSGQRRVSPNGPQKELELLLRPAVAAAAPHRPVATIRKLTRTLATFVHGQAAVYTHPKMRHHDGHIFDDAAHHVVEQITRGLARPNAPATRRRRAPAATSKRRL